MNKRTIIGMLILLSALAYSRQTDFPKLTGPYLGQKPPGMTAEVFAPGVISTQGTEYSPAFTPGQDECFYTIFLPEKRHVILHLTREGNAWRRPAPAPFAGADNDADLTLSPDGKKAFFWSNRPLPSGEEKSDADLWMSEKSRGTWSAARWLGNTLNNNDWQIAPTVSSEGNLYFASYRHFSTAYRENFGKMDLYRSELVDGVYGDPVNLGISVNTASQEKEPFIFPDESYILFASDRPGGFGDSDLYVSFRTADGSWTEPRNLGESVNSSKWEGVPIVSPDGKYLFFSSDRGGNSDVYWISAEIILRLRPEKNKPRPPLADRLKLLEPLVNKTWVFVKELQQDVDFDMITEWKTVWDGNVVRYLSESKALDSRVEGYFYYDAIARKIAFFRISNKDVYENGFVTREGEAIVLTGSITLGARRLELRYSLEFTPDGRLIDKAYTFKNGAWKAEHAAEFKAAGMGSGSPTLTGPYFGQKPPGLAPALFAPEIVATANGAGCYGFMSDGMIFVFEYCPGGADWKFCPVQVMEEIGGKWTKPAPETFDGLFPYNFTVAPDGRTLYFSSLRLSGGGDPLRFANIWKISRTSGGWSRPFMFDAPVNTEGPDAYPTVTTDGTLYFMSVRPEGSGKDDIYRAPLKDGTYPVVENLGLPINSEYSEVDAFIAPDESILIFCSDRPGGRGKFDLYVSFRKADGRWSKPVNMGGAINTPGQEFRPSLSPDGKYFFFTRYEEGSDGNGLYWVSAKIIDELRPEDRKAPR